MDPSDAIQLIVLLLLLALSAFFSSAETAMTTVNKIRIQDLGVNPMNDGKVIRLNFPPLTEEKRKLLAKDVYKRQAYTARRCTQFRRFKGTPRKGTLRVGQK